MAGCLPAALELSAAVTTAGRTGCVGAVGSARDEEAALLGIVKAVGSGFGVASGGGGVIPAG